MAVAAATVTSTMARKALFTATSSPPLPLVAGVASPAPCPVLLPCRTSRFSHRTYSDGCPTGTDTMLILLPEVVLMAFSILVQFWVNWIHAITNMANKKNATTIYEIESIPVYSTAVGQHGAGGEQHGGGWGRSGETTSSSARGVQHGDGWGRSARTRLQDRPQRQQRLRPRRRWRRPCPLPVTVLAGSRHILGG